MFLGSWRGDALSENCQGFRRGPRAPRRSSEETLGQALDGGSALIQPFGTGILNVRSVLVVLVKQHFVQASPIKCLSTFCALREVLFFFGGKLFVFFGSHCLALTHSIRSDSLNANSARRTALRIQSRQCPIMKLDGDPLVSAQHLNLMDRVNPHRILRYLPRCAACSWSHVSHPITRTLSLALINRLNVSALFQP